MDIIATDISNRYRLRDYTMERQSDLVLDPSSSLRLLGSYRASLQRLSLLECHSVDVALAFVANGYPESVKEWLASYNRFWGTYGHEIAFELRYPHIEQLHQSVCDDRALEVSGLISRKRVLDDAGVLLSTLYDLCESDGLNPYCVDSMQGVIQRIKNNLDDFCDLGECFSERLIILTFNGGSSSIGDIPFLEKIVPRTLRLFEDWPTGYVQLTSPEPRAKQVQANLS